MSDPITIPSDSASDDFDSDDWKAGLQESLDSINGFGKVATAQHYDSFVNPGLEIGGNELIPLPLTPRDALTIKNASRQAPFGKGDETVVDTSVRKTWELDHTQFKLKNPKWPAFFSGLVQRTSSDLGLVGVDAHAHKLLLYKEGSFFKAHKDTEKERGMVGTLVVCLPAQHTGGDVLVSFRGEKNVLSTASTSPFDMSVLAWYSDVTHEVKPLTSGYRLAITYNLVQTGSTMAPGKFMLGQQKRLSDALGKWSGDMRRVFYPLEHKYTKSSISLKNLKGRDRAVFQSLLDVAPKNYVAVFLVNMTRLQYEDDEYGYGDVGEGEASAEVYTRDGTLVLEVLEFDKNDDDVLGAESFWTRTADEIEEGEFTGNESAPEGYRYHDSAILLMPWWNLTDLLSQYGAQISPLIDQVLDNLKNHSASPDARQHAINFFTKAVTMGNVNQELPVAPRMVAAAVEVGSPALYQAAIKNDIVSFNTFGAWRSGGAIARTSQEASMGISEDLFLAISILIRRAAVDNPNKPIKWDEWLGDLARLLPSLSTFDRVVYHFHHSMEGDLKKSLSDWKKATIENWLGWRDSLVGDDLWFITKMLTSPPASQQQGTDWVVNRLLPVVSDKGTPTLLRMFLSFIFKSPKRPHIPEAKSIFQHVLDKCLPKLAIQPEDLRALCGVYGSDSETRRPFVDLISQCLSLGLLEPLERLMQAGAEVLRTSRSQSHLGLSPVQRHDLISGLLQPILSALDEHNAPPTEATKAFLEAALRHQLDWPQYPRELPGWSHRPRGCSSQGCSLCQDLDTFLRSENQQETTFYPGARSKHIELQLSDEQFSYSTTRGGPRNKYIMTVKKKGREITYDMKAYRERVKNYRGGVAPLRSETLKKFIGEESYREIIGDGGPASSGQSVDGGRLGGGALGVQLGGDNDVSSLGGQRLGCEKLGETRVGGQMVSLGGQQSGGIKREAGHEDVEGDVKRPKTDPED